ncbi:unnamed protein product [Sympodiomycopsis kandeliae]
MCRLLVFKGVEPIQLSNLVTKPAHSIINQAFDARLRLDATRSVNGDGFGLGWYDAPAVGPSSSAPSRQENDQIEVNLSASSSGEKAKDNSEAPCIFTSVTPAWNNQNLQRLCEKIRSPLVFAHIRASTSGALSETNCHPWRFGRLMWMHNGQISSFNKLKRVLLGSLDDELLNFPQGQTDSEWIFALFLSHLERPGREEPFGWKELKSAMENTIADLNRWAKEKGVEEPSLMNFCVTDGLSVLCTRYVSSLHDEAASLYFSSGTSFYERSKGLYRMRKEDRRQNIVVVASEPLTFEKADWMEVPTNTMIVVTPKMNVLQIPILDEYSPIDRPHPAHRIPKASAARSSTQNTQKGLPSSLLQTMPNTTIKPDALDITASSQPSQRAPLRSSGFNIAPPGSSRMTSARGNEGGSESISPATTNQAAKHRSPDFAISAGFPPNGHVGHVSNAPVSNASASPLLNPVV